MSKEISDLAASDPYALTKDDVQWWAEKSDQELFHIVQDEP